METVGESWKHTQHKPRSTAPGFEGDQSFVEDASAEEPRREREHLQLAQVRRKLPDSRRIAEERFRSQDTPSPRSLEPTHTPPPEVGRSGIKHALAREQWERPHAAMVTASLAIDCQRFAAKALLVLSSFAWQLVGGAVFQTLERQAVCPLP